MPSESPRKQAWQRIQAEAPDIAELLGQIQARFGRARLYEVVIRGEQVWPPAGEPPDHKDNWE